MDSTNSILFILCLLFAERTPATENTDPRSANEIVFLTVVIFSPVLCKKKIHNN